MKGLKNILIIIWLVNIMLIITLAIKLLWSPNLLTVKMLITCGISSLIFQKVIEALNSHPKNF